MNIKSKFLDYLVNNIIKKQYLQDELKSLSKQRIQDVSNKWWFPMKGVQKKAIRKARNLRSQMSKAELNWMLANPDKATKIYKSGSREFGGLENKLALQKARREVMNPLMNNYAKEIRNKRLAVAGGLLGSGSLIGLGIYNNIDKKEKASPQEELQVKRMLAQQGIPEEALKGLTIPKKPVDRFGNLTKECATYVNTQLRGMGINAGGDAYQMGRRYNDFVDGYKNVDITPNMVGYSHNDSIQKIRNIHYAAADNVKRNLDMSLMRKNHIYPVNMYYKTSPHMIDFYNKAIKENTKTPATHIGYAYWDGNTWRVTHNIHGKIHNERLQDVLGNDNDYKFGVTSIRDAGTPIGLEDQ